MLQLEFLLPLLPWLIILLAWLFLFVIDASFQLEKYGIEVGPFIVFARTQRLNNLLDRLGRWHPRAWRYLWSGFVAVCFAFSIYALVLFTQNLFEFIRQLFSVPGASPGPVVPLLPGITMSFSFFAMLLIPIIVSIFVHEFAHGIAARADDVPVKSSGLFAVFILWGAFVEPDDDYVKEKTTRSTRVRLFAAGSAANLSLAFVVYLLITAIIIPVPQGALITGVVPGSSADGVLTPWTTITGMNGTPIRTGGDLSTFMRTAQPNDLIIFTVNGESIELIVGSHPNNASQAYIGIYLTTRQILREPFNSLGPAFGLEFQRSIGWFFIITFSLGIMNLLPVPGLDGDQLFKELIDVTISLERKSGRIIHLIVRLFALIILILNIAFTFLTPGLLFAFFR